MQTFFVLEKQSNYDTEFLEEAPWCQGEAIICPDCGAVTSGLPWLPPIIASLECWGSKYGDIVFAARDYLIVAERFLNAFHDAGLSGIVGSDPVTVSRVIARNGRVSDPIPTYLKIDVVASQTAVNEVKSNYEGYDDANALSVCVRCRRPSTIYPKRWSGIVIDDKTWDGNDIFRPRGMNRIVVSSRFAQFALNAGFDSFKCIPATTAWDDLYPEDNYSMAARVIAAPVGSALLEKRLRDGSYARFEPSTGYLVRIKSEGAILSITRVRDRDYWDKLK